MIYYLQSQYKLELLTLKTSGIRVNLSAIIISIYSLEIRITYPIEGADRSSR